MSGCLAFGVNLPGTGAIGQVFATIVGNNKLLAEVVLGAIGSVSFTLALPYADERKKAQEGIVKRRSLA